MSETKQEACNSKPPGWTVKMPCVKPKGHSGNHEDCCGCWWRNYSLVAEPVIEVAPGEPTCEYCGPVCYRGAEHNARVEDGARYTDDPAVPAQEAPRGCNLAEIPGHDCAVDACEPSEPQAGAQEAPREKCSISCEYDDYGKCVRVECTVHGGYPDECPAEPQAGAQPEQKKCTCPSHCHFDCEAIGCDCPYHSAVPRKDESNEAQPINICDLSSQSCHSAISGSGSVVDLVQEGQVTEPQAGAQVPSQEPDAELLANDIMKIVTRGWEPQGKIPVANYNRIFAEVYTLLLRVALEAK